MILEKQKKVLREHSRDPFNDGYGRSKTDRARADAADSAAIKHEESYLFLTGKH